MEMVMLGLARVAQLVLASTRLIAIGALLLFLYQRRTGKLEAGEGQGPFARVRALIASAQQSLLVLQPARANIRERSSR